MVSELVAPLFLEERQQDMAQLRHNATVRPKGSSHFEKPPDNPRDDYSLCARLVYTALLGEAQRHGTPEDFDGVEGHLWQGTIPKFVDAIWPELSKDQRTAAVANITGHLTRHGSAMTIESGGPTKPSIWFVPSKWGSLPVKKRTKPKKKTQQKKAVQVVPAPEPAAPEDVVPEPAAQEDVAPQGVAPEPTPVEPTPPEPEPVAAQAQDVVPQEQPSAEWQADQHPAATMVPAQHNGHSEIGTTDELIAFKLENGRLRLLAESQQLQLRQAQALIRAFADQLVPDVSTLAGPLFPRPEPVR